MNGGRWIRVTTTASVPRREGRPVSLGGRELAIFNLGERFLAVENRCPHRGGPLADGIVSGCTVVCPLHAWKVSLESGAVERPSSAACVRTFATRVEGDVVLVEVPAEGNFGRKAEATQVGEVDATHPEEADAAHAPDPWLPPSGGSSSDSVPT